MSIWVSGMGLRNTGTKNPHLTPGVDDRDFVSVLKLSGRVLRGSRIWHDASSSLLRYPVFDVVVRLPRDAQFFAKLCDRFAVTNGVEISDFSALVQRNSHPAIPPLQASKKLLDILSKNFLDSLSKKSLDMTRTTWRFPGRAGPNGASSVYAVHLQPPSCSRVSTRNCSKTG